MHDQIDETAAVCRDCRINPLPLALIFGERTRPAIARRAAVNLATHAPVNWRANGRGPHLLDDLGFVRICVQAARDWNPGLARTEWDDPIADLLLDPGSAKPKCGHVPNALADLCHAWGLLKVELKARRPGDVLLYPVGPHGAACSILVDLHHGGGPGAPDRIAMAPVGKPPEIRARHDNVHIPLAAFTWPES